MPPTWESDLYKRQARAYQYMADNSARKAENFRHALECLAGFMFILGICFMGCFIVAATWGQTL